MIIEEKRTYKASFSESEKENLVETRDILSSLYEVLEKKDFICITTDNGLSDVHTRDDLADVMDFLNSIIYLKGIAATWDDIEN